MFELNRLLTGISKFEDVVDEASPSDRGVYFLQEAVHVVHR